MWLQRKVPGRAATDFLAAPEGLALARMIAEAAFKVHGAGIPTERRHTMADELEILRTHLSTVAPQGSRWAARIARLVDAADRLGAATPGPAARRIQPALCPHQAVADGRRLF